MVEVLEEEVVVFTPTPSGSEDASESHDPRHRRRNSPTPPRRDPSRREDPTRSGLTSARRGCGAGKRGPLVSGSGESGSTWTGTTRVVHRRSTEPTAQIALGADRTGGDRGGRRARLGIKADRPARASGGGTRASRCRRRHPAAEATAQKRRESGGSGRRQRPKATASASGKKRKGEGVLTGGDGGVRRRGATEGGRHAADGDRDDLKNEKKEVKEEERGHRRRECRPKAADMATLTVARWEWRSGDEPRRRRGGRGGSRPREPDGGDGAVRRRPHRRLAAAGVAETAAARICMVRERWEARESSARWGKSERERRRSLNRGGKGRTWPGEAGLRRPTWEVGEEREAGFENRIPAISSAGASGGEWARGTRRTRGRGRRGPKEAETWARRRLRARRRGGRLGKDPTGGPHLSATPGEEGGGAAWLGLGLRPAQQGGGGGKERMGRRPIRKRKGKRKRKKEKRIFPGIKILLAQF
uniref:Uncharacterized protein n=1 Tax=Oryza sativa subsp. japonica TaxID=39947 RepID=Q688R7_ORYSJ|nr:hypothetical protein [Oryza sativa Japonica Group]